MRPTCISGGNCNMRCSAPTKCTFSCTRGNCKRVICGANTCVQSCTGGGCGLECSGKRCQQRCTMGNCQLQCPGHASSCQQRCTVNRNKCTVKKLGVTATPTTLRVVPRECRRVTNGICYQYCVGGGCNLACFKSPRYHSCQQVCTGEDLNQNILRVFVF